MTTQLTQNQYPTYYFNRTDVKAAFHAPQSIDWSECANQYVFVADGGTGGPEMAGDTSADPIQHVLPQVIEATNRVLIANGDYDMIIITNGSLLAIQNMTWNGAMGFQNIPSAPINVAIPDLTYAQTFADNGFAGVDGPQGVMGIQHYERGLMWSEIFQAGHMIPEFQPRVAYQQLEWVLGLSDTI